MGSAEKILDVKPTLLAPTAGRILISVPFYNDPFFNRTVVMLTDYDENGAAGLILNKEAGQEVSKVAPSLKIDKPLYVGGPVFHDRLFALHTHASCKAASRLIPGIYTGYDDVFIAMAEYRAVPELRYKFFIGYSGWSALQLDDEIDRNMWVIGIANHDLVFNTPTDKIWETAVRNLGEDYCHWLQVPELLSSN